MLNRKSNEVFGSDYSDLDLNQKTFILNVVDRDKNNMENIQIFQTQKESLKEDINKIRDFLNKEYLDKLPIETAQKIKRKLAIKLNELETERNKIATDLNHYIEVSIYKAEADRYLNEDFEDNTPPLNTFEGI